MFSSPATDVRFVVVLKLCPIPGKPDDKTGMHFGEKPMDDEKLPDSFSGRDVRGPLAC